MCTNHDFGDAVNDIDFLHSGDKLKFICIEEQAQLKVALEGDRTSRKQKNIVFKVTRCKNEIRKAQGKSKCRSDAEIDEFIYDLEVSNFVKQESIDSSVFNKMPIYTVIETAGKYLLNKNQIGVKNLFMQRNMISTYD